MQQPGCTVSASATVGDVSLLPCACGEQFVSLGALSEHRLKGATMQCAVSPLRPSATPPDGLWLCLCAESNLHPATEHLCRKCNHTYCGNCWKSLGFKDSKIQNCVGPARRLLTFCSAPCSKTFFDAAPTLELGEHDTRARRRYESYPTLPKEDCPANLCMFDYKGQCKLPDDRCFRVHIPKAYLMSKLQLHQAVALIESQYRYITTCNESFAPPPEHTEEMGPQPAEREVVSCRITSCRYGHDTLQYLAHNPMLKHCPGFAHCKRLITRHIRIQRCTPCAAEQFLAEEHENEECVDANDAPFSHADSVLTEDWFNADQGRILCKTCNGTGAGGCTAETAPEQLASTHKWDELTKQQASDTVHAYKQSEGIAADDNSSICLTCAIMVSSEGKFLGYLPSLETAKAYYKQVEVDREGLRRITSSFGSDTTRMKEQKGFSKDDAMGAVRKDSRGRTAQAKVGTFMQPRLERRVSQSTDSACAVEEQQAAPTSAASALELSPEDTPSDQEDDETDDDFSSFTTMSSEPGTELPEFAEELKLTPESEDKVSLQLFTKFRPNADRKARGPQFAVLVRGLQLPVRGQETQYVAAVHDAEKKLTAVINKMFHGTTGSTVTHVRMPPTTAVHDEEEKYDSSTDMHLEKPKKKAPGGAGANKKANRKGKSIVSEKELQPSPTAFIVYTDQMDAVVKFVSDHFKVSMQR